MEIEKILENWANKITVGKDELKNEFDKIYREMNRRHSSLSQEMKEKEALRLLQSQYRRMLRTKATVYEGVVLGYSTARDTFANKRKQAIELYKRDPEEAIRNKVVNENGVPIDKFGRSLPEQNMSRNVYGVGSKKDGIISFFNLRLQGNRTEIPIPIYKPVKFMAIDKTQSGQETLTLSGSSTTSFIIDETIPIPKATDGSVDLTALLKFIPNKNIKELSEYHETMKQDYNRFVAVEGTVYDMNLDVNRIGNRRVNIADFQLDDFNNGSEIQSELVCWVPVELPIDFGVDSKILVFGQTSRGKKQVIDESGKYVQTDEPGDVLMNVYGIYPLIKVGGIVEKPELTEEDISPKIDNSDQEW